MKEFCSHVGTFYLVVVAVRKGTGISLVEYCLIWGGPAFLADCCGTPHICSFDGVAREPTGLSSLSAFCAPPVPSACTLGSWLPGLASLSFLFRAGLKPSMSCPGLGGWSTPLGPSAWTSVCAAIRGLLCGLLSRGQNRACVHRTWAPSQMWQL